VQNVNDEKTDIILLSEECLKNASLAARVACRSVTSAMLMRVRRSFRNRIDAYERSGGQYVKHLFNMIHLIFMFCLLLKHLLHLVFQSLLSMSKNDNDNN
jgi:hypothetical protein